MVLPDHFDVNMLMKPNRINDLKSPFREIRAFFCLLPKLSQVFKKLWEVFQIYSKLLPCRVQLFLQCHFEVMLVFLHSDWPSLQYGVLLWIELHQVRMKFSLMITIMNVKRESCLILSLPLCQVILKFLYLV